MNPVAAEILTIGTELLLGEIVDTNTRKIAIAIREIGLDLYRTSTVGDNPDRIAMAIKDAMKRSPIILTTGGLGPTVDDVTREGIAQALNLELEFRPDLWEQIEERFARFGKKPTKNNRRQAEVPAGAVAIENPIGTAPGFMIDRQEVTIISMPGVPAEMVDMLENTALPLLKKKFNLRGTIHRRILRTAGEGESAIDAKIQDLERMSNPTVGLSAHPGRVDIRITAKANSASEAEEMIWKHEATIRQRLGDIIYGIDEETLEGNVARLLQREKRSLCVVEAGTNGLLSSNLSKIEGVLAGGVLLPSPTNNKELNSVLFEMVRENDDSLGMGISLQREGSKHKLHVSLFIEDEHQELNASYGGPPDNAPFWAISHALNSLRMALG